MPDGGMVCIYYMYNIWEPVHVISQLRHLGHIKRIGFLANNQEWVLVNRASWKKVEYKYNSKYKYQSRGLDYLSLENEANF